MTPVLQKLSLLAFRGASELLLDGLTPITLLVGANNAGKSSTLEATALLLRGADPGQWVTVARHRDIDMPLVDALWSLFPGGSSLQLEAGPAHSKPMLLEGTLSGTQRVLEARCVASEGWDIKQGDVTLRVELRFDRAKTHTMEFRRESLAAWAEGVPTHRVFTVTPATHRSTRAMVENLSRVVDEGKKNLALQLLKVFDPGVVDLEVSSPLRGESIRVTHQERGMVDLPSFGDGMRRSAALALALTRASQGVALIDELEAGIHHTALVQVLTELLEAAAKSGTQLIATTHSLDAIDAVIRAAENTGSADALSVFYLKRAGGKHEVRRYDHAKTCMLREEGFDLR